MDVSATTSATSPTADTSGRVETDSPRTFWSRFWYRQDVWITFAVFVLMVIMGLSGDLIDVNNGLGWDGKYYGDIIKDPAIVIYGPLNFERYLHRTAPLMVAHVVLRLFSWPITDSDIIRFFVIATIIQVTLATWFVVKSLEVMGAGHRTMWAAMFALVLNWGVIKWLAYYPVITDATGFFLGAALLYAFVSGRLVWLYLLTLVSAFSWPAAYYEGLILTVCQPIRSQVLQPNKAERILILVLPITLTLAFVAWSVFLMIPENYAKVDFNQQEPMYEVLPVAIALGAIYFFVGSRSLTRAALPMSVRSLPRLLTRWNTWLAVFLLYGFMKLVVHQLPVRFDGAEWLVFPHLVISGIYRPGIFLVSHAIFLGTVIPLALLVWPRICRLGAALGPGLPLALAVMLIFAIGSESRRHFNFLPLLVALTVLAVDFDRRPWSVLMAFGVICAVTSRVWQPIGRIMTGEGFSKVFMSLGPWITLDQYLFILGGLVVVTVMLWALFFSRWSQITMRSPGSGGSV